MIDETVAEIKAMRTSSSSAVAVKAAESLRELSAREYASAEEFERDLEHNAGVLRRSSPSHASLHNAMRALEDAVVGDVSGVAEGKRRLEEAIDAVVDDVETGKREAAAAAAERFSDGETFLTHDYSTTVLEAVEQAVHDGVHLTAHVTEARPRCLGRRTARHLAGMDRVDVHLGVDSAMAHALEAADRVVLGMTCVSDGVYYNRVGTHPLVATANALSVPVTVVGSGAKVIEDFRFENQRRDDVEVVREPIEGVAIENPVYDATPVELVDEVVTDEGVLDPAEL